MLWCSIVLINYLCLSWKGGAVANGLSFGELRTLHGAFGDATAGLLEPQTLGEVVDAVQSLVPRELTEAETTSVEAMALSEYPHLVAYRFPDDQAEEFGILFRPLYED
jgi:hypothetical protein